MKHETKTFAFEDIDVKEDGGALVIVGYGSTFGGEPDSYNDVVSKGAFAGSLAKRKPKMLYQHDARRLCGVWDEVREDGKGLHLKGRFINTTLGRDASEEAKSGALDSMSIGFRTLADETDRKTGIRTLNEVDLFEVSLVTFPANAAAVITDVRHAAPATIREFEDLLRDAGSFSREQAKAIAARGFKALDAQREAEDLAPLLTALTDLTLKLKESYVR